MSRSYGLLQKPCGDGGKAKNRIQAERYLEDDHFHCMVSCFFNSFFYCINWQRDQHPDDGEFCFEHPLIFNIFNHVFFGNKKSSIGVAYADYFNPLPLQTIALIVTAVSDLHRPIIVMTDTLCIYR